MKITLISTLLLMIAYFLVLYSAVSFIQDKRLFSSAPKEFLPYIPDRKERFKGAHTIGWMILAIAIVLFVCAIALSIWDGFDQGYDFSQFFIRFIIMFYGMEIYDIFFFDWFLLCHSNFYPHYYPELKGIVSPKLFGFNKKSHILHFVVYIPICALVAWVCVSM